MADSLNLPPADGAARIVVGVNGSPSSRAALRWAAEEARLRGADLYAVHAWAVPVAAGGVPTRPPARSAASPFRAAAETLLHSAIRDAFGSIDPEHVNGNGQGAPPSLHRLLIEESATAALVRLSQEADLLVVGAPGRGRLLSSLLGPMSTGSVARASVHRAACPVVIVPDPTAT